VQVFIRANLIGKSGWSLAKGITIASRYLTVRRQFGDPEQKGSAERQVLHYPSVFHRVLPLLGEAYAFIVRALPGLRGLC
jgi:acyl-CoA oxidase